MGTARLRAAGVAHAMLEGDFMAQVHPAPRGRSGSDEARGTQSDRRLGELRGARLPALIYTNTLGVLPEMSGAFERALGADVRLIRVLLTASDATAHERLVARELGSELEDGLTASEVRARVLDQRVAGDTARVSTDGRTVIDVATEIVALTGWRP